MKNIIKQDILAEIHRTAKENNGVPLGQRRFEKETGIKPYDWGKYWARFSDAQREAGFDPNTFTAAYNIELLLEKYTTLMQELGCFPTSGDLLVKTSSDPNFPSEKTMRRLGNKKEVATKILEFAKRKGYSDIVELCEKIIAENKVNKKTDNFLAKVNLGEVYLFKSGRYYKIGKTYNTVRRGSEIRIQLPEKLDLIHSIKTDDPSGVEAYWHRRFEVKRMQGEWFNLSADDVKAFKRWRRII